MLHLSSDAQSLQALDSRLEKVALGVLHVRVEWAGSMHNVIQRRIGHDGLVKSTGLGNVLDNDEVELRGLVRVLSSYEGLLGRRPDCTPNPEAKIEPVSNKDHCGTRWAHTHDRART